MSGFGTFIAAIAGPVVKRALISIGFGVVSYAAYAAVLTQLLDSAKNAWGALGGDVLAFVQIAGVNTAMSIIAGALTARIGMSAVKKLELIK